MLIPLLLIVFPPPLVRSNLDPLLSWGEKKGEENWEVIQTFDLQPTGMILIDDAGADCSLPRQADVFDI